jgi:hypothetical protein
MSRRVIAAIAFAWVLSLVSVVVWAQSGQAPTTRTPIGDVITDENIGFQRTVPDTPTKDGRVIGEWVVKINGKWMMTQAPLR